MGHTTDDCLFHVRVHLLNKRAGLVVERRAAVNHNSEVARELDAALMEHAGTAGSHLEHLLVGDLVDFLRAGHDARVGRVDAVDIRVNLAHVGLDASRDGHRGRIGAAASECRDVTRRVDALEPGDDDDVVIGERALDARRVNLANRGLAVDVVRDQADLTPAQADGLLAQRLDRHREKRHGDHLTCREQRVHLARRRRICDGVREFDEVIGRFAHGRDDGDDPVAGAFALDNAARDVYHALRRGNRSTTEFCYYC